VGATDVLLARNSQSGPADALKRIDPWAPAAAEPVAAAEAAAGAEELLGGLEWFCEWQAGRSRRGLGDGELTRVVVNWMSEGEC